MARNRKMRVEPLEDRRMLATFTVTNLLDGPVDSAGDLPGSLRQAIFDANASAGADEIEFSAVSGAIALTAGELAITEALSVNGPGKELLTIDAQGNSGIFHVTAATGNFELAGMTLRGGSAGTVHSESVGELVISDVAITDSEGTFFRLGPTYGWEYAASYAVYSEGNLRLTDTTVDGNESTNPRVGGFFAAGDMVLTHSSVTGIRNFTDVVIAAIGSVTLLDGSSVTNNYCAEVGGIFAVGDVLLVDSLVEGNSANMWAGGFGLADAGGILSGQKVTLVNSIVRNNVSTGDVGGISAKEVYLDDSQVIDNRGPTGGIWADYVEMNRSKVAENTGDQGFEGPGGIYAIDAVIRESEISDNIGIGSNNAGGIFIRPTGSLTLIDSTVTGNQAKNHYSVSYGDVGAINNSAGIRSYGSQVIIVNSTISGNINTSHTTNGRYYTYYSRNTVGGLFAKGEVQILNSTIAANTTTQATTGVGGLQVEGNLVVQNSIVANNLGSSNQDLVLSGTSSFSYSLIQNPEMTISGPGNIVGVDPMLGPLQDNGGPTWTHALLPGSPAIDAGDPTAEAGVNDVPLYDQRGEGFGRVRDGDAAEDIAIDMGAFEVQSFVQPLAGDFDGDGDVDGRDFLAWQRNPSAGDLSDWQENYGSGGLLVASGELIADFGLRSAELEFALPGKEQVDPRSAIPGLGVFFGQDEIERNLGSRLRGNDMRDDLYVEDVDRALEQWNPSALRGKPAVAPAGSFGEMVARRGARARVATPAGMDF